MADKFNKEHTDIQVELVDGTTNLVHRMQMLIAGGMQLDIGFYDPDIINRWGQQGLAIDLAPYVAREQSQYSNFFPSAFAMFQSEGKLYGLPWYLQLGGLFYNKDAYSQAGLANPGGANWTYDALKENAIRLQKRNADNVVTRWGWKFPTARNWVGMVWSHGGDFVDSWTQPKSFTGFSPETTSALSYIRSLDTSGAVMDKDTDSRSRDITQAFKSQFSVMAQTNTLAMFIFMGIKDFEWDIAALPKGPVEQAGYIHAFGWMILEHSKNKDAAWEVLKYFSGPEGMATLNPASGAISPDRRYMTNWITGLEKPASRAVVFEGVEKARAPGGLDRDLFNILNAEVNAVRYGDKGADAALETMNELVNIRLAELNGSK